ncbi:hypothetical protein [Ketobacter alkanivorans]|uniref:Uncharacterized protein n=1 Tax=Ketobacter alkanivorans TaxID=1917421 RepID=A0A2K9LPE4_9GAMM|nr:hypothetical protein [Ketobacter alkanivorans]AUM14153.1 hypothetical protein Kalk_17735 [Ketobacter alkanivorans]MCP5018692.1 hypothetical protein [Ketobacter sp.]
MNMKSITASWVIALGLLGIFSLMKQPTLNHSAEDKVITIPQDDAPHTEEQMNELEAKVWCALDGHQVAQVQFQGTTRTLEGAMAIAPHWAGNAFSEQQLQLITPCINQRLQHLALRLQHQKSAPAMDYLFTQL